MIQLIRKNPMLAAGILLPVVVVVFFVLATAVPRWLVAPPQYDFVFTSIPPNTAPAVELRIAVEQEKVTARVYAAERGRSKIRNLYLFDHETQSVREIPIKLPTDLDNIENGAYLDIPELESRIVSTSRTAPDGYEVRNPDHRYGDFLFFRTRRLLSFTLHKEGAVVEIPRVGLESSYYYSDAVFVGWLVN